MGMGTISLRTFHVLSLCWDDDRLDKIHLSLLTSV